MSGDEVEPGQRWMHETQGPCIAVEPDPRCADDWIMRREGSGEDLYMYRSQRDEWRLMKEGES
jgi:hypothetical protein